LLVYKNPNRNMAKYTEVMLPHVKIWTGRKSKLREIPKKELKELANFFYSELHKNLSKDYKMVMKPSEKTLQIEVAITDADTSNATMNTISTIVPQARLLSSLKGAATGKAGFVGEATAEARITDAHTGDILFAAIDRRVGGKEIDGMTDSWDDVKKAFTFWAEKLAFRLCKERGSNLCVNPGDS
jgi:G:T-mismatch repair DNA endonuclease (very short patch repair protein)